jgi:GDP-4-dehydro-6-deoxy-D-mannose reductase
MRALITGASGFVGRHLAAELEAGGHEVIATDISFHAPLPEASVCVEVDILDQASIAEAFTSYKPDCCVHLAGKTFAPEGEEEPARMFSVNVTGTLNVLETVYRLSPAAKVLTVSSGHVYGNSRCSSFLNEQTLHEPTNMYAISKSAADRASLVFASRHDLNVCVARPNNHTGPGQGHDFVVPSIVAQVKTIAASRQNGEMKIGNPESSRDFLDVRDVVRAYRLLLEKGSACKAYNVSSGTQVSIGDLVKKVCELAGVQPEIRIDRDKFRPTDCSPKLDTSAIEKDTGWSPRISLDRTIKDMLNE